MAAAGRLSGLVIQALRELGKNPVTPGRVEQLRRTLPADKRRELEEIRVAIPFQRQLLDFELRRLDALVRFGGESRHDAKNTPQMQASMRHRGARSWPVQSGSIGL